VAGGLFAFVLCCLFGVADAQSTPAQTQPATQPNPQPAATQPQAATEQLVVFVSQEPGSSASSETAVSSTFVGDVLPDVRKLMDEMGVELVVIDVARQGAPQGVALTPQMVYQNHRGRFPYLGRFTTLDRLKNHVRTARFGGAPTDIKSPYRGEPQIKRGRAVIGMPIKVTDLAGSQPDGFDHDELIDSIDESLVLGLAGRGLVITKKNQRVRSDRLFYADFYPYRSEDGKLYVSTALFSQFHCHEPVFTSDSPVAGSYDNAPAVFAKAADLLRAEIARQLNNPENGDGFNPIASDTPTPTWRELGLPLPPEPERGGADVADVELVRGWTVDASALERGPMVQFRFPEPIVGYAGEAKTLKGSLTLGEGLSLPDATGEFVVPIESLTMGDADLDHYIRNGIFNSGKRPESRFELKGIETGIQTLTFGSVIPAVLKGEFTMKGVTVPLSVPASVEAYVGEDGKPRVSIRGTWGLRLDDPFGISDQPPGPEAAARQLKFTCNILLKPAE